MVRQTPNDLLVVHDFAGYIMSLNAAYLVGTPVKYQATEGMNIDTILNSYKEQSISDLDSELAEDCSVYGKGVEVIYADENAEPKSAKLNVRNAIIIRDDTFRHEIMYAVSVSPVLQEGKPLEGQFNVTVWNKENIWNYKLVGETLIPISGERHFFGDVPVIEYPNNKRFRGDFEIVISLIDAYNILQSDRVIDREKLVDAILAFYGTTMSDEDRAKLKNSRMITMPADAKGEYIIKNINEADADVLRKTIAKDIHKFSKTPDMTDEEFSGNSSGVAISYKLLPFEENCKAKERYFERGLMKRFKLYNHYYNMKSKMELISTADVDAIFTRSLPKNDLEISQMINNLDGIVDKPLLASQLSFVKDGEETVELAQKDQESDLSLGNYGTTNPDGQDEDTENEE